MVLWGHILCSFAGVLYKEGLHAEGGAVTAFGKNVEIQSVGQATFEFYIQIQERRAWSLGLEGLRLCWCRSLGARQKWLLEHHQDGC